MSGSPEVLVIHRDSWVYLMAMESESGKIEPKNSDACTQKHTFANPLVALWRLFIEWCFGRTPPHVSLMDLKWYLKILH